MKSRISNNLFLKLSSIVLALLIWLVVIDISNPEVTLTKVLTLNIYGEEVITAAGKSYKIKNPNTVSVTYKIRSKDKNKIVTEDFDANINLENLYDITGAVPVNVDVLKNANLIVGNISVKPSVISVETEDIQRKEFKLSAKIKGTPIDGYSVGKVKLDPEKVVLNGPVSIIGMISGIGLEIDAEGASTDFTGELRPVFYDANGNKINIDENDLHFDDDSISYSVKLLEGKTLKLNFLVGGEVASGYRFVGAESSTKAVSVFGLPDALEGIETVDIPATVLDISEATADKVIDLDISEYLPPNINISGESKISVILKVEALNKKSYVLSLDDIEEVGRSSGYKYKISPEKVTVVVSGLQEELEKLTVSKLGAKIDYTHILPGTYSGSLLFDLSDGLIVDSYTPFELIVYRENEESIEIESNKEELVTQSNKEKNDN